MKVQLRYFAALVLAAATFFTAHHASGQAYPNRPIKLVVGFSPGGGTDILARLVAQFVSVRLGQPIVVDNKPGASGNLATEFVAKAAPDGYTLLLAANTITINPHLFKQTGFDVVKDLRGVGIIATTPIVIVTSPSSPITSLDEFIAYAKKNPGKLNYGTAGVGTAQHLAMEILKTAAGINLVHIPYKGSSQALADLMGGQTQIVPAAMNSVLPLISSGRVRGIAVADAKRVSALKDLPTIGEVVKGYEVGVWFGIMAPAQTPNDIVNRVNQELARAVASPEMAEKLTAQSYEIALGSPEQMDATVRSDIEKWGKAVKAAGITPE